MSTLILKTDVIAVKFFEKCVLSGIGNYLHIHNFKTGAQINAIQVFYGQKIHGLCIASDKKTILVYGGKQIKTYKTEYNERTMKLYELGAWEMEDWILSAQWINRCTKIAIVSAHNVAYLWDTDKMSLLQKVCCSEKCILYSATIVNDFVEDVIILSGTVFSEILIWKPFCSDSTNNDCVLFRLQGHTGVIFSIEYNETVGLICSTSDDRSVRLWTVLGKNLLTALENPAANIMLRSTMYGHTARVWRSQILSNQIVSIGEDSNLNIWDFDGNIVNQYETHQGDCIWSLDCSETNKLIVTGGGDGGLCLYPLYKNIRTRELLNAEMCENETFKKIALLHDGGIVGVTENGTLLYYESEGSKWRSVSKHDELNSYSLLEVSNCRKYVVFGGIRGNIFIYKEEINTLISTNTLHVETSKLHSIIWLKSPNLLVLSCDGGILKIIRTESLEYLVKKELTLPKCRERWLTCALMTEDGCLVCGDRLGNIHVYHRNASDFEGPTQTFSKFHGRLGVSCLLWSRKNNIISTGRDGTMKKFKYDSKNCQLVQIAIEKLPFKWLARILTDNKSQNTIVIGFCGSNFNIWCFENQRTLLEINCGGGHRSWDFNINNNGELIFVFIKNKTVFIVNDNWKEIITQDVIQGFHAKEINCMESISFDGSNFFISGGEDTTLRVSKVYSNDEFCNLKILKSHLSSVRCLGIIHICQGKFVIFSGGGRGQLIVSELIIDNFTVECVEKASVMLKNTVNRSGNWNDFIIDNNPETRLMDITLWKNSPEQITAIVCCSDGMLRLYKLNYHNDNYTLVLTNSVSYNRRCILKVASIFCEERNIILSMATDGKIAFWDLTEPILSNVLNDINPFSVVSAHQSGINSFCCRNIYDNKYLIATGGDDNTIVVQIIQIYSNEISWTETVERWQSSKYHSCQITGLCFSRNYLISASIDQRITVFKITTDNGLSIKYIDQFCTVVSDIHGITICSVDNNEITVCVYGKGFELLKIPVGCPESCKIKEHLHSVVI